MTTAGIDLLMSLLTYDPEKRITAEEALQHDYFKSVVIHIIPLRMLMICWHVHRESPYPKHPDLFGSFPSAAAGEK